MLEKERAVYKLRKMSEEKQERLLELYDAGVPIVVIGRAYNVGGNAVRVYVQEHGRALRGRGGDYKTDATKQWMRLFRGRPLSKDEACALVFAGRMKHEDVAELSGMTLEEIVHMTGQGIIGKVHSKTRMPRFEVFQVGQTILVDTPVASMADDSNSRGWHKIPATIIAVYPRFYLCETDNGIRICQHITDAKRVVLFD